MYTHVWMKSQQVGIVKILLLRVTLELKKCLNYFYLQQKSGSFFRYEIHSLLASKADDMNAPGCWYVWIVYMGVSKTNGTPKSSILIGFSIINHPFWGTPIFGWKHPIPLILGGLKNRILISWEIFLIPIAKRLCLLPPFWDRKKQ